MTKVKPLLGFQTLISLYYAFIYPYLTYGCILWGNNYAAPLSEIVRLQNKAIRVINDVPLQEHITPHYVKSDLLKFSDIVKLNTCQILYDHVCGDKSSELTLFNFSFVSEQHNYAMKIFSTSAPQIRTYRINIRKFCPTIIGKYYWNNIPLSIRLKSSKHSFRQSLFRYYFAQY